MGNGQTALSDPQATSTAAVQLSVVVPTFNERDNIAPLIGSELRDVAFEVIVVDDNSPDGTWQTTHTIAMCDPRIRCLRRIGRRGLSGACIEGILAAGAPFAAVIDADMQHDETRLPAMLALLRSGEADLVIGSRYIEGGSAQGLAERRRQDFSRIATVLARRLLGVAIADPMSGFFMIRTDRFGQLAPSLSVHGFKILLDIIASARGGLRIREIPYTFGTRLHGDSKLSSVVALDFLGLLLTKLTGDAVPPRFLMFAMVGAVGVVVNLATLFVALRFSIDFVAGETVAAFAAMSTNFLMNNWLTYRDQRLRGLALLRGLVLFYLICSVGLVANVGVAFWVYGNRPLWWFAGVAGALMGAVWNYSVSRLFVWWR